MIDTIKAFFDGATINLLIDTAGAVLIAAGALASFKHQRMQRLRETETSGNGGRSARTSAPRPPMLGEACAKSERMEPE
jgi:hypothetical protein